MNRLYRQLGHFTVFGLVGIIAITARDAVGNETAANDIINQKIKITGFAYPGLPYPDFDRYNLVGHLAVPNRNFVMPCNQDITITASVLDPDDPTQERVLFTDTLRANTASTCTTNKYRIGPPAPDLHQVVLERLTPTRVSLYVEAFDGNYLSAQRETLNSQEFLNFFARIKKTKLTVQFSDGRSWAGWSDGFGAVTPWNKEKPCVKLSASVYERKVELRCNR